MSTENTPRTQATPRRARKARQRRSAEVVLPREATEMLARSIVTDGGKVNDGFERGLKRVVGWQRPVVVAYIRRLSKKHPTATPAELARIIEVNYVRTVTTMGAAGGAAAIVPGLGTLASLGLSAGVAIGYLEATALYAQGMAELHGVAVDDPERAGELVMALMLGEEGIKILKDMSGVIASGGKVGMRTFFATAIGAGGSYASLGKQLHSKFLKKFAKRQSASALGRAMPFGAGAAFGGVANRVLARRLVRAAHELFGDMPTVTPRDVKATEPRDALEVAPEAIEK